eukprot:CAMPEP_0201214900 /NCGR_PEP_ID=MMETSP0851-20130426/188648_1 /ASSEMBLY_ACC=CAM_ASM_000631 /TAXON_ID=183588 /ORGANISM="Pseudo-nitzschia fraudulenta, Strain WWA7" /LENGTH=239 /DNA_ID=CAMNT_0047504275 /DNA_START=217 /DNA_END=936 /DNA_ORIENTATION=-
MKTAVFASLIASAAAFAPAKQAMTSTSLAAFEDALGSQPPLGFFDLIMKTAVFASLIASAAAFAPAKQAMTSTSLAAFEDALGSQPPLGFFDPLGLVEDGDQEKFDRLRYVEIKHGRICMLAFLGQIVTRNGIHLGGAIDNAGDTFDSFPNGWAAISGPDAIPQAGLLQIVAFVAGTGNEFVGDFRNGSLDFGWDTFDEETKLSKRAIELNNGRAAMMGTLGLMVHEQLGGSVPVVGEL